MDRPLTISVAGYVLIDCNELERLEAIEARVVAKLEQLKLASSQGKPDQRRVAHIEALAFVLATDTAVRKGEQ